MRTKLLAIAGLALTLATGAFAQNGPGLIGNFAILDPGQAAIAYDVSDSGLVVGAMGGIGFTYRKGVVTPFVAPPVQGLPFAFSQIYGVNNAGDLVGEYFALGVEPTGYVSRNGALTTIAFPDPAATRTIPHDISNHGHVSGFYLDSTGHTIGFLLRKGVFEKIEIPNAQYIAILGMNDSDELVGHYSLEGDYNYTRHGILWTRGQIASIDYPGAEQTEPYGIGRDGTIVGSYTKTVNGLEKRFGFVLRNGQFKTIGIPGVMSNAATGINARGEISGYLESLEFDSGGNVVDFTSVAWIATE